jgi:hypothetical protein
MERIGEIEFNSLKAKL